MEDDVRTLSVESVKRELQALRQGASLAHPSVVLRLSPELRSRLLGAQRDDASDSADEVVQIVAALRSAFDRLSRYDQLYLTVDFNLSAEHSFPTLTERQESLASRLGCASKTVRRHAALALDTLALVIVTGILRPSDPAQSEGLPSNGLLFDPGAQPWQPAVSATKDRATREEQRTALVFGAAVYDLCCHLRDMPACPFRGLQSDCGVRHAVAGA